MTEPGMPQPERSHRALSPLKLAVRAARKAAGLKAAHAAALAGTTHKTLSEYERPGGYEPSALFLVRAARAYGAPQLVELLLPPDWRVVTGEVAAKAMRVGELEARIANLEARIAEIVRIGQGDAGAVRYDGPVPTGVRNERIKLVG
jgi:transcriptional regulator with XRE-family HTH domain